MALDNDPIVAPKDGMEFWCGRLQCPCGRVVRLWFNSGELDCKKCKCGTEYQTEHASVVLRINPEED